MCVRSGRLEKRIRLAIPVHVSSLVGAVATERTTTENVSSDGVRILTELPRDPHEQLIITSVTGSLKAWASVVYCQKLPGGRFGVGLQFERLSGEWPITLPQTH